MGYPHRFQVGECSCITDRNTYESPAEDSCLKTHTTVGELHSKSCHRLYEQAEFQLNEFPDCYQNLAIPHEDDIYLGELRSYFSAADDGQCVYAQRIMR